MSLATNNECYGDVTSTCIDGSIIIDRGKIMANENDPAPTNPNQPIGDPEWGHSLNFKPGPNEVLHDFCGENDIVGGSCPNCKRPLTRLLSLHAKDPILNLDQNRFSVVHLVYCWTCSIPFGNFSYKIGKNGSIKTLNLPPRQPDAEHGLEGPYDGYTGMFPNKQVSLESIDADDQLKLRQYWHSTDAEIAIRDGLDEPRHQVGGYPFIYNSVKTDCPECGRDMPLFAAICNDARGNDPWRQTANETFVGNGGVQMIFHLCRKCSIVSAYSSSD
jgi:hypothetical protein